MSTGEGFYDAEELRKQIKDLKIQTVALEAEESVLLADNARCEDATAALKKELNILEALAEVHNLDPDDGGEELPSQGGADERVRWAEENRKLEVQILNQEIRAALPRLEAEALRAEMGIHALQKKADALAAKPPSSSSSSSSAEEKVSAPATSMFQKSVQELEDDMGSTIEARIKLRALMALDADAKRRDKAALLTRISALRDQLYGLLDEREVLREASKNLRLNLGAEEARVALLLGRHAEARALIGQFHSEQGWQKESFLYHTAATDAVMSVEDVPAALRAWIPSAEADLTLDNIRAVLGSIPGAGLDSVTLPVYLELASRLDAQM